MPLPRIYLLLQSVLIAAWWILLACIPPAREVFAPAEIGGMRWLLWFLPADILTASGGLLAAWRWPQYAGRLGLILCVIGISTQTLACLTVPFRTSGQSGWLGAFLMHAASIGTLASAGMLIARAGAAKALFRAAPTAWSAKKLARQTLLQSLVLWPLFLIVLPWSLSRIERAAGWSPPDSTGTIALRVIVGLAVLIGAGAVNIATARVMVREGGGTPLPTRMARRLVTRGPYARIRNPMCLSALMQGMGVAILLASPLTAAYVILGGIVWQVLIRPTEEEDLLERFGPEYAKYRSRVRCWWPRL